MFNKFGIYCRFILIVVCALGSVSCDGGSSGTSGVQLTSIQVAPSAPSLAVRSSKQFVAIGTYSDGTTKDITGSTTWASSFPKTASIGPGGLAQALLVGTSKITATTESIVGTAALTVSNAKLMSITVTPPDPTLPQSFREQLTATGNFNDSTHQDLTDSVDWVSSDSSVATVGNASGAKGVTTGVAAGTAEISATFNAVVGKTDVKVTDATLTSVAVTPTTPKLALNQKLNFTATGTFSDKTTKDLTDDATWSSSDAAKATVSDAAGSKGQATGVAAGTADIEATVSGTKGMTLLTVTTATLASIEVAPTKPSIAEGTDQQFKATGIFSDKTKQDLTEFVTWSSSSSAIATVSNAPGSQAVAHGLTDGSATITATSNSIRGDTELEVTSAELVAIQVTPGDAKAPVGADEVFKATGIYTDNSTQDLTKTVSWSSSRVDLAEISNAAGTEGVARGLAEGETAIEASLSGITGQQTLLVTAAPLESIAVTPADPTTPVLTKEPFKATGTYTDGHTEDLTKMVLWTSSDETIATISNAYPDPGAASALADGKTEIKAELAGITGVTELTVVAATLESIAVTPADQTVPLGIDEQFTATGTYDNGHTEDLTKNVTWSSSDKTIATISNASPTEGLATGHAEGKTTITATLGGLSGNTGLTVTTAVLVSIDVTPKDQEIGRGKSLQFTATGTFSDSTTEDLTKSVTWKSSAWLKIKISNAEGSRGLAHVGLLAIPGKSTISATSSPETGSIKGETEATAKLL